MRLPWAIRFLFNYLAGEFVEERPAITAGPRSKGVGLAFRADAKAEGQCVRIGGWECLGGGYPTRRGQMVRSGPHEDERPLGLRAGRTIPDHSVAGALRDIGLCHDLWRRMACRVGRGSTASGLDR